jgi:hypothetical protein
LNAGEEVRNKRLQRLEPEFRTTRVVEVMDLSGDFLLPRHRLRVGDFRYMRALP